MRLSASGSSTWPDCAKTMKGELLALIALLWHEAVPWTWPFSTTVLHNSEKNRSIEFHAVLEAIRDAQALANSGYDPDRSSGYEYIFEI